MQSGDMRELFIPQGPSGLFARDAGFGTSLAYSQQGYQPYTASQVSNGCDGEPNENVHQVLQAAANPTKRIDAPTMLWESKLPSHERAETSTRDRKLRSRSTTAITGIWKFSANSAERPKATGTNPIGKASPSSRRGF